MDREENHAETDKNSAIKAKEGKEDASVCLRDGVIDLVVILMNHSNRFSRNVVLVDEVFGTTCDAPNECIQDGLGKVTTNPLIEKTIYDENLLNRLRREERGKRDGCICFQ